jgi:hypothetical protein
MRKMVRQKGRELRQAQDKECGQLKSEAKGKSKVSRNKASMCKKASMSIKSLIRPFSI